MKELINQIVKVEENAAVRLAPNVLMWKEGSSYDIDVTNKQFDDLETLLSEQKEKPFYLIDLSVAGRPTAEMVQLVEERLKPINSQIKHAAVYTGSNYIMYLGIKFYFIKFGFESYSAHAKLESALKSFV